MLIIPSTAPLLMLLPVLANGIMAALTDWIANFGYIGIFGAALLETIFPPIPSELIFPLIGYVAESRSLGMVHIVGMAAAGAVGSTAGAVFVYFLSLKIGRPAILRLGRYTLINESKLKKAEDWFERHGALAVMFGRLAPGIREIISVPAGLGRMNIIKFIVFTFIGSFIWSLALAFVGYFFGETWGGFIESSPRVFDYIAISIVIIIVAVIAINYYRELKLREKKMKSNT